MTEQPLKTHPNTYSEGEQMIIDELIQLRQDKAELLEAMEEIEDYFSGPTHRTIRCTQLMAKARLLREKMG